MRLQTFFVRCTINIFSLLVFGSFATFAQATSPVCGDPSFPKFVDGAARIETQGGGGQFHYTIILPEKYENEPLNVAWLRVPNPSGGFVKVQLETRRTGVAEWKHHLVGFVHAEQSLPSLSVEAEFGFPCRWFLTANIGTP